MSIGTALTVSALALMTFFFRRSALQIGERGGLASAIESGLGLIAGALLLALGSLLLWGSYAVPVSPFRV